MTLTVKVGAGGDETTEKRIWRQVRTSERLGKASRGHTEVDRDDAGSQRVILRSSRGENTRRHRVRQDGVHGWGREWRYTQGGMQYERL